ncbi:helix-turn-helix domain-containing protein [Propionibacterium freudenreichii]|uniref:helix-turn-helix domain-containing protein n=1 Tax=Propionibacterium freudenreichii TaxID=1744 RepID=UPI0021A4F246|nr:helix-turn-helix transcriptional regulator [Propionibacterium freudenreichii]MCT2991618.1 XRE family transcriptional regulator [Propionibacterium freudenreichii]MCT2994349.1 XRE family transcriptional regulator [Propionibacterium freudenreichii]MDK9650001.1 helix-turn-helix transcriptional regulator [Propionibacterium freudenreichii]MDK9664098.1 helix-turn-helix transcriptional regulator [Propionibacterium freudenreichii]
MKPPLLRVLLGQTLREQRIHDRRTLRDVSLAARVSLGYLSEVERGQKEASSELLFSICQALNVPLSEILREVSEKMLVVEAGQLQPSRIGLEAAAPSVIAA